MQPLKHRLVQGNSSHHLACLSLTQTLDEDEESNLKSMMTLWVNMNTRLATNEQRVESLAAEMEATHHILFTA